MSYNILSILRKIKDLNPEITSYYFNIFPSNNMLHKNNDFTFSEKIQLESALEIREKYGFSFWESLMSTFSNNPDANFKLLNNSLVHNENNNISEINANSFEELENIVICNRDKNLAFLSQVKTSNEFKQLPLIDFHIIPNELNKRTVDFVLNKLGLKSGFLINSGKSYHFISKKLVNQKEFEVLLIKMIFFSPIIDRNWIAHQLLEKKCALRITKGEKTELQLVEEY